MKSTSTIDTYFEYKAPTKHLKRDRDCYESAQAEPFIQPIHDALADSSEEEQEKIEQEPNNGVISTSSLEARGFCTKWLRAFIWLTLEKDMMICKWCKRFQKKGKFVKGSLRYKIDGLRNHASSKKHLQSIGLLRDTANMQPVFQKTFLLAQKEFERHFRLVEFIAKENLAIVKYPQLINLMKSMGVTFASNCYQTIYAFREMLLILSEVRFKELVELIKKSPWFSIMLDESTDIAVNKSVIIYIRYYNSKSFCVEKLFF